MWVGGFLLVKGKRMTRYKVTYWHPHCDKCKDRGVALGESLILSMSECEALYDSCPRCFKAMGAVETAEEVEVEKPKAKRKYKKLAPKPEPQETDDEIEVPEPAVEEQS